MKRLALCFCFIWWAVIAVSCWVYVGCKTPPIPDPIPNPFPTTTTTTIPPDDDVHPYVVSLPATSAFWSATKRQATITVCEFDGANLRLAWTYSEPWTGSGDDYCDKVVCFYAKDRAAYVEYSGKYWTDHVFNSIGENLANGHGDLGLSSGDPIGFFVMSWTGEITRSDIYWTVIP